MGSGTRRLSSGAPSLSYHRFFQSVLPYLAICICLAAAPSALAGETTTPNASSIWLDTLWNLPVKPWFVPPQPVVPAVDFSPPRAACRVAPLPVIADVEALAFENATAPDTGGLEPAMVRALEKFRQLVSSAGGTFELKSGYRPLSYQAHLQAVWFKWMLVLRNNRQPACQALRAQVGEEFARHHLLETQSPVTASDHTRGLAFDATVIVPGVTRLKKRRVSLDRLALLAGIRRPDILRDPVHFKLAIARVRRRV